jgi:hypothetical protein
MFQLRIDPAQEQRDIHFLAGAFFEDLAHAQ